VATAEGQSRYRSQGASASTSSGGFGAGGSVGGFASASGSFGAGSGGRFGAGGGFGGGAAASGASGDISEAIPGVPGDDYPIFAEVPETSFLCDGQIEGGYYADTEADCQAFHICAADGEGGLTKYSFLCPNGTLFNQQYFICDWWFNVDCSLAEGLYSRNAEIAAERQRYSGAGASNGGASFSQGGGRPFAAAGGRPGRPAAAAGGAGFASGVRPGRPIAGSRPGSGAGVGGGFAAQSAVGSYGAPVSGYSRSARNIDLDETQPLHIEDEDMAEEL